METRASHLFRRGPRTARVRVLADGRSGGYSRQDPVRILPIALLAALPLASVAKARGVVLEPGEVAPGRTVTVSWQLPAGFEESELLIELDGGPRVRLTEESRQEHPRFAVRLPAVVGTARFVVRAGRKDGSGRHREITVATSETFSLAFSSVAAPVPVRAPASRPAPGEEMEWWAEGSGRSVEGPSPALESPVAATDAAAPPEASALPSSPPVPAASPLEVASGLPEGTPVAPLATPTGARERSFPGATTPLRN